jgi:hypothetical protein
MYGLNIIQTYSSPAKTEYNFGDQQIYVVAQKELQRAKNTERIDP